MHLNRLFAALSLAFFTSAQNVTDCVAGGVCYAVNVPEASSSSGSGDIYIHITGPSSMSWIGIGQGSSMRGANMFMIYANEDGSNVTLSPRLGVGEQQSLNSGSTAQVTLLAGSGIAKSTMTANFKCSNCNSWDGGSMSFANTQSSWMWAYRTGDSILSNSLSVNLNEPSRHGNMTLNLQAATGGDSMNPFLRAIVSQTPAPNPNANNSPDATSTKAGVPRKPGHFNAVLVAHAVLGSVAFVILYPLGAIVIRVFRFPNVVWFHAGWMVFTYAIVLTAIGMGVWLAVTDDYITESHATIGLFVVVCLLLQPITGLLHHRLYKSRGGPSAATSTHVWWGRAVVTLGIVNGALGLHSTGATQAKMIAYLVVAGVMWALWIGIVLVSFLRSKREARGTISDGSSQAKPASRRESIRMSERRRG